MPGPHRRFLEHLITVANIRQYVEANTDDEALAMAYDECLKALSSFRDKHLQIVSRYIVIMSQQSRRRAAEQAASAGAVAPAFEVPESNLGLARESAAEEAKKSGLTGTGGTQLMPFLKQSRDETLEPVIGASSNATSKFESLQAREPVSVSPVAVPLCDSPKRGFAVRSCKVNDLENDVPVPRVTGVGMAGDWDIGDDLGGGICHS